MIPEVDNSKEAAAYRMLRQVLHNHSTTQDLPFMSALTSVGLLLGHLARHLHFLALYQHLCHQPQSNHGEM